MNTYFEFRSLSFNVSVPRDYFINPSCYGDDLAAWLMQKMNDEAVVTGAKPEQEDFGWYFTFIIDDVEHCVVVGFQPNDPERGDRWIGWIERNAGFIGSILGGRGKGISPKAVAVVNKVLSISPEILDLTWSENPPEQESEA